MRRDIGYRVGGYHGKRVAGLYLVVGVDVERHGAGTCINAQSAVGTSCQAPGHKLAPAHLRVVDYLIDSAVFVNGCRGGSGCDCRPALGDIIHRKRNYLLAAVACLIGRDYRERIA